MGEVLRIILWCSGVSPDTSLRNQSWQHSVYPYPCQQHEGVHSPAAWWGNGVFRCSFHVLGAQKHWEEFWFSLYPGSASRFEGPGRCRDFVFFFLCFFPFCFLSAFGVTPCDAQGLFLALHSEITLHGDHHMGCWGIDPAQPPARKMLLVLFLLPQDQSFKRCQAR